MNNGIIILLLEKAQEAEYRTSGQADEIIGLDGSALREFDDLENHGF